MVSPRAEVRKIQDDKMSLEHLEFHEVRMSRRVKEKGRDGERRRGEGRDGRRIKSMELYPKDTAGAPPTVIVVASKIHSGWWCGFSCVP